MLIVMGAGAPAKYKLFAAGVAPTVELPPYPALPTPTASHADLLICPLSGALYTFEDYYRNFAKPEIDRICAAAQLELRFVSVRAGSKYPLDVPLCAKRAGRFFIASENTAPELLTAADIEGLEVITVRQGYTACSAAAAEECIVTADRGIYAATRAAGADSLLISPGGIDLPGYDYGFIGGSGGYCAERRELWFFGDIATHPDGNNIRELYRAAGIDVVSAMPGRLFDCGGIFFF